MGCVAFRTDVQNSASSGSLEEPVGVHTANKAKHPHGKGRTRTDGCIGPYNQLSVVIELLDGAMDDIGVWYGCEYTSGGWFGEDKVVMVI